MAEFDRLAEGYDENVSSFEKEELEAVEVVLGKNQCHIVLDVGVGTGRVSKLLQDSQYETIGIDVSMPMLLKAKSKGLRNLVLADAKHLPFRDGALDASLLVDVLNCLDDPVAVFSQVVCATRGPVVAIKRKYNRDTELSGINDPKFARLRYRVQKFTSRPTTDLKKSWEREDKIIQFFPPLESIVVSDRIIETSSENMITKFERGAFRFTCDIPHDELRIIANELRIEMSGSYFRRRRIREMVVWDAEETFPFIESASAVIQMSFAAVRKRNLNIESAMPKPANPNFLEAFTSIASDDNLGE